jgi:hemolysin activation/secretion protein
LRGLLPIILSLYFLFPGLNPAFCADNGMGETGEAPQQAPQSTQGPEEQAPQEPAAPAPPVQNPAEITFAINDYQVEGNSVLPSEKVKEIVSSYLGPQQHMKDVEQARTALEKAYREAGYPTVLVIVPQQMIENGIVRLSVVESKLGEIRMKGNRYFSNRDILERLPSLKTDLLIYEPALLQELNQANTNPDLEITPVLALGQRPGTVDLELNIKDRIPLHGSLEWNNRGAPESPKQQLNASIQYTNLLNRDQLLTFQTVQTPQDWGIVQVYGLSYVVPIKPSGRTFAFYGAYSHSKTVLNGSTLPVSQGSIGIPGNSEIAGSRYIIPVDSGQKLSQQISLGIDYKQLNESKASFPGSLGTAVVTNQVNYAPLSVNDTLLYQDNVGTSKVSGTVKGYVAGMVPGGDKEDFGGDPSDPVNKPGNRAGSTGTFLILQGGLERSQDLPMGSTLSLKADGQWASEPLIAAEEYFAGGVDSVRGYLESEALGDNAFHWTVELFSPTFPTIQPDPYKERLQFTVFYDSAYLYTRQAPAGQISHQQLDGMGFGMRLKLTDYFQGRMDFAWALKNATFTQAQDFFVHFSFKVMF